MKPKKMRKLGPERFPWSRYHADTVPPFWHRPQKAVDWLADQNIVGYCPGMELKVRPSECAVGVLIDCGGYETWSHLEESMFELYQQGAE